MVIFNIPPEIRKVADSYKNQVNLKFSTFCAMLCYFLFGLQSLSALVRMFPRVASLSSLSREIQNIQPNRLMRRLRTKILKKFPEMDPNRFCFAIDDTSNPCYGKTRFKCGKFKSSSGFYQGQKILAIVLVDIKNRIAYPLAYDFLTNKKEKDHIMAHTVAINLFKELLDEGFPALPVTADSWFDSVDFMKSLNKIGIHYCGQIKSNRNVVAERGYAWKNIVRFFKNKERLKTTIKNKYYVLEKIFIKKLDVPVVCCAVFNKKNDNNAFGYYVSTDLTLVGSRLWKLSRARWCIETMFRDLKQSLSFGKISCSGENVAHLSVCFPLILFAEFRLNPKKRNNGGMMSMEAVIKSIREQSFMKGINFIIHCTDVGLIDLMRRRKSHVSEKPTNRTAEAA